MLFFTIDQWRIPEDLVEIYYNDGSIYFAYRSKIPDDERNAEARNKYQKMVKKYFENTIKAGKKDPRERVQVKKQIYGHLRVAALLLDCTSTVARTRIKVIPPQDIANAVKHLDILEHQLADVIPRGTRVQILKTRSDQYYRQGSAMYPLAKKPPKRHWKLFSIINSTLSCLRFKNASISLINCATIFHTWKILSLLLAASLKPPAIMVAVKEAPVKRNSNVQVEKTNLM